ncbi:hypothetical protein [Mycolicibacterium litorale]|nr:hypothetical protein [Mycolicibacterium litorale]
MSTPIPRPWFVRAVAAVFARRTPKRSAWMPAAPSYLSYQVRIR